MSLAEPTPDVRTEILDAATRLFAARGFDGTPVQAIADAVGIRKQSLLYHFGTKDQLRENVLDRLLSRWNEVLPRLLKVAAAGEEIFDAIVREVLAFFSADPDRARLLMRELLDRPEQMRDRLTSELQSWLGVLGKSLRKGQELGQIRPDVDIEAYLLETAILLVGGVASGDAVNSLLTRIGPSQDEGRTSRELIRIARASLFLPSPELASPPPIRTPNPISNPSE